LRINTTSFWTTPSSTAPPSLSLSGASNSLSLLVLVFALLFLEGGSNSQKTISQCFPGIAEKIPRIHNSQELKLIDKYLAMFFQSLPICQPSNVKTGWCERRVTSIMK